MLTKSILSCEPFTGDIFYFVAIFLFRFCAFLFLNRNTFWHKHTHAHIPTSDCIINLQMYGCIYTLNTIYVVYVYVVVVDMINCDSVQSTTVSFLYQMVIEWSHWRFLLTVFFFFFFFCYFTLSFPLSLFPTLLKYRFYCTTLLQLVQ